MRFCIEYNVRIPVRTPRVSLFITKKENAPCNTRLTGAQPDPGVYLVVGAAAAAVVGVEETRVKQRNTARSSRLVR